MRPVLLSGGSGTRLWPLSTPEIPKQFAPLFGTTSLFGMTLERLEGLPGLTGAVIVTGAAHAGLVRDEMSRSELETHAVLVEPVGRNTAPAVIAAALVSRPEDVLVILPSDHLVADVAAFRQALSRAAEIAVEGGIVTLGIRPTRAETGFGYIEIGDERDGAFEVGRFTEKPTRQIAAEMVADGRHLWNSGMFITRADQLLDEARTYCPSLLEGVSAALPPGSEGDVDLGEGFAAVDAISFDYAIMEKTERAVVLPVEVGWDDVGSYRSLLAASERDADGNHLSGSVTLSSVQRSFIVAKSRQVVVAGLSDVVVVETPDVVLVVPIDLAQEMRDLQQRASRD
jgi:mannose-1-phosphate guanylyltransferase/mannose-6-phosphate isomerase